MVQDHQKPSSQLKALVEGGKVRATLPTELDSQHQKMLDELKAKNGKDFDASDDQTQVKAHQDAVALFDAYAKNGDNAELKGWAFRTLPHLREHLSMAEKLQSPWVYPRPDRRSCRPMLASCEAWGGTLSASRRHHLSITLIARCIAKYRSPEHVSLLWSGRVHGPHPFIIAERPSQLKPERRDVP